MNRSLFSVVVLIGLAGAACDQLVQPDENEGVICAGPGRASIVAQIYDMRGTAAAIGTTVAIRRRDGYVHASKGFGDSVHVAAGENRGGVFQVTVSRPWHTTVIIHNVHVPEGPCGNTEAGRVIAHLALLPGAPPVRQVVVPPHGYGFGWGNMTDRLEASVVAAPGVSEQVNWISRDTSVIRILPDGTLTTRCRRVAGQTWAVATSVVDASKQDSVRVSVAADTNPARCP